MKVKTSDLKGRALDYAVAVCEGYGWAKNMSKRSGDSSAEYRDKSHKPRWPVGSRCIVSPSRLNGLHETKENWDGWCVSTGDEPIAPAAFYSIKKYSSNWSQAGPIIEREWIDLEGGNEWLACYYMARADEGEHPVYSGDTPLQAAMRCYVASKMGDKVEIPEELL